MNLLVILVSKWKVRNNISKSKNFKKSFLHPRTHKIYSIYFYKKFLKFFHTGTMRFEMLFTQFRVLYHIMNLVFLELEIELFEKHETSITSTLIQNFIRFC